MEFNRLIAFRETQRNWNIHEQHLKQIRPLVNTGRNLCPEIKKLGNRCTHSTSRLMDIEFENRALLSKLTKQKCITDSNSKSSTQQKPKKNNKKKNFEEYKRNMENAGMLKRLNNTKASYQTQAYASKYK